MGSSRRLFGLSVAVLLAAGPVAGCGHDGRAASTAGADGCGAYDAVAAKARAASPVTVLPGSMLQGQWDMPSGGGYVAALIKDAGGTYPWAATSGAGSTTLDLETVLAKAKDAKIWLVTENTWKTLADAEKADARYAKFDAFASGNVWSANKVLGPGGGNDFFERGVARPDLILGDLLAILHPDLAPGHRFTFYRQLTR